MNQSHEKLPSNFALSKVLLQGSNVQFQEIFWSSNVRFRKKKETLFDALTTQKNYLEDHARTRKWLGSPPFISHFHGHLEGSHNRSLGDLRSPWPNSSLTSHGMILAGTRKNISEKVFEAQLIKFLLSGDTKCSGVFNQSLLRNDRTGFSPKNQNVLPQ